MEKTEGTANIEAKRTRWLSRVGKWLSASILALLALLALGFAVLNSPIGKRFIADQIAQVAPASGLRIAVGRISGDIFGQATVHDVVLSDPKGKFLTIPVVELDWRPLSWLTSGLDVRKLIAQRGTLWRVPELLPGDPDAPILPDFDIRIDWFQIDDLTIAKGIAGQRAQKVNLLAKADIRAGRVYLKANGKLGSQDRIYALVDAEPDGDKFDLALNYRAAKGGVLAGLLGVRAGYDAILTGEGTWSQWRGALLIKSDAARVGAFTVTNRTGRYGIIGQADSTAILTGFPARTLGKTVSILADGTLKSSVLSGKLRLLGQSIEGSAAGAIDLANNRFDGFKLAARLTNPEVFGAQSRLEGTRLAARLDGPFRKLSIQHELRIARFASGATVITDAAQKGTATFDGKQWHLPLSVQVGRIVTGEALLDPLLVDGVIGGTVIFDENKINSDDLGIAVPGAKARLALRGDTRLGNYSLSGPIDASGLQIENIGAVSGRAKVLFTLAREAPWRLSADVDGRIPKVSNATLANLAGPAIAFRGGVALGGDGPITFNKVAVGAAKLSLLLDGKIVKGTTTVAGSGRHTQFGAFTAEAEFTDAGPSAELVFARPMPAAGLRDVHIAIVPTKDGFAIDTKGDSTLGPFAGQLGLYAPAGGPTRIAVQKLDIWKTSVSGDVTLSDSGATGNLALAGGGLDGTIGLTPSGGGQAFELNIAARKASFGGSTPISIARANIAGSGLFLSASDSSIARNTITGSIFAEGLSYGNLFIGKLAANADLTNGSGPVTASLSGRRGGRFNLQVSADVAADRLAIAARGDFGGRRIRMPRRAILDQLDDGGWQLQPTQLSFGQGIAIAEGRLGGGGPTSIELKLANMPLSLADIAFADLGLGGTISGLVDFRNAPGALPIGNARVQVKGLSRSGLVLTSRPTDLSLVMRLTEQRLETRAVIDEDGRRLGRLQGRVTDIPAAGGLFERLQAGKLLAQLRYNGSAEALWRLAAIEGFDLTGPVSLAADMTGTLADPRVRGSIASDKLRLQSSLSGTDILNINARGSFAGSLLHLNQFSGIAANGGTVSGSGTMDLSNLGTRGPGIDIRVSARNARLLDAVGLNATVSGPLRIVSDGVSGTIAGRVAVDRASWSLGNAAATEQLPQIATRHVNLPADIAPVVSRRQVWRYLIDAKANSRVDVDGLGLDSEWSADIRLRGTTSDPRIGGRAGVVRGSYSFAGTRFELTRGKIDFDETVPIDPQIDIVAETSQNGLAVTVSVQGNALRPEIAFSSSPSLPEEEILSRLLFGGSITELSATDAVQLGAALASLRGGGGLDPINKLRSAIGLDRLRIESADPALGRGTAVALGKNIGRRFYVELVTDGGGYSATQVEFRITNWLALLGSISTVGKDSVLAEVRKDY